ncbi:hypothetical protein BZA77DRAFT_319641 [Pyronema omphalodes]|nr:hypothetical protein BZA77DRAFT_319641 [Pyronema omphalodes]
MMGWGIDVVLGLMVCGLECFIRFRGGFFLNPIWVRIGAFEAFYFVCHGVLWITGCWVLDYWITGAGLRVLDYWCWSTGYWITGA